MPIIETGLALLKGNVAKAAGEKVKDTLKDGWKAFSASREKASIESARKLWFAHGFEAQQPNKKFVKPYLNDVFFGGSLHALFVELSFTNAQVEQVHVTLSNVMVRFPSLTKQVEIPFRVFDQLIEPNLSDHPVNASANIEAEDITWLKQAFDRYPAIRGEITGLWSAWLATGKAVKSDFSFVRWVGIRENG